MLYKPVVVALRRDPDQGLERRLDLIMRPFVWDPDGGGTGETEEEEGAGAARCDGWRIGGRWAGWFLSAAGHRGLVDPAPFPEDSPLAGRIARDGGPKRHLDLDHVRAAAEAEAWRGWPAFDERRRSPFTGRFREPETAAFVRSSIGTPPLSGAGPSWIRYW
ncbi:hypothetical protein [Nocardiopsis suaedae]|uniref:Uncharacterized protein n=1 Tax=Nocardiopsis suaedae TaxID=3018444 RepID=A0ABT4TMX5_9ACTN|nr:hypothetical protein [Nocardiopsis suaedae]MDA2806051.1 hypothetical protein [Nocardiopsis suaedae]